MKRTPRRPRRLLLAAALMVPLLAGAAEPYPSRPIRVVVPFGAGGTSDVVARLLSAELSESLKQTVNVDPKPGANGIFGTDIVAKAAPDGYTLLLTVASAQTLTPALYKLPFDPVKDFAPVSLVANLGGVFLVNANVPARTMQEFAAEARTRPGRFNYGAGTSLLRLIGEQLKQATDADITMVPYKGTGPQLASVVGGEVDAVVDPFVGMAHVKSGKVRPLAVLMNKRSPLLPDMPTLEEAGIKGIALSTEIARIVALPDVRERLAALNYDPVGSTPAELGRTIDAEIAKWKRVVKEANYKAED